MLIPFVFELLQGPLLVIPQAMASRSLTPHFIKLRTLERGLKGSLGSNLDFTHQNS